ncbi:Outer-membrane lipoprotein carrier protein [bacterium HR15]|nr:Outer-membrane lipoprotein carrier protein [bacterium HR15]
MRTIVAFSISIALLSGLFAQDAKALLKQAQQKYRQMKSMEAAIEMNVEMVRGGNSNKMQFKSTLAMQKPNKLAMKASGSGPFGNQEAYSDGKELIIYLPAMKQYIKQPAPPDFEGPNAAVLGQLGMLLGFANENLDNPNSKARFTLKGKKNINGKLTHLVEVSEKSQSGSSVIRLYVGVNDLLIHRLEMDQRGQMPAGQQGQPPQQLRMKVEANIRYISFNKPIPANRFKFTPPKDAKPMQMPQPGTPTPPPQGQK